MQCESIIPFALLQERVQFTPKNFTVLGGRIIYRILTGMRNCYLSLLQIHAFPLGSEYDEYAQ